MDATLVLASPFDDHAVLRAGRANPLWGWDRPGQPLDVELEGSSLRWAGQARADERGRFELLLPALPAGGPYTIRVRGSSERRICDVLAGEVWLAMGQSNMEWPVLLSEGAEETMRAARHAALRYFHVERATAREPLARARGHWRVVDPSNVGDMTAVGYFFARALEQRLGVPIGIVGAAWGGTVVEAWTSREALLCVASPDALPSEPDPVTLARLVAEHTERVAAWEAAHLPPDPGNRGEALGFASPEHDAAAWPALRLPAIWQRHGLDFNGVVWFRCRVEVPSDWAGAEAELGLGIIDDFDHTYVNGVLVGAHAAGTPFAYQLPRRYRVPAGLLRPGANTIAVRVFDHGGEGGFLGPAEDLYLARSDRGERIGLAREFRYAVEHRIDRVPPDVFADCPRTPRELEPQNQVAALHNGMIAPLIPYGITGALFYQGESNEDTATTYRDRFTAMIRDVRTRWGQGQFPFYFVQLANFRANSRWAVLREAQHAALGEPNTAMVTAIDLGEPLDIHPRDKRSVGERLAGVALRRHYGFLDCAADGPRLSRVDFEGSRARVHFEHADGLHSADGEPVRGFELASADRRFFPARGSIDDVNVIVASDEVRVPVALRYAFTDDPEVNLVNGSGLPALPFRTDGW